MNIELNEYDTVLLTDRAKNAGLTIEEYMIFSFYINLTITEDELKEKLEAFKKIIKA